METRTIQSLVELDSFADEIISILPQREGANVLLLKGDLGAGKTTFTQILAKKLGVAEHVVSPTFMIMRTYEGHHDLCKKFVHIDAYRIEDISEVEVLRIPELFTETGTVVCIEWPERIPEVLPQNALTISFAIAEGESRTVTYGS
ncbi:tRNA (adenosine(37)-N6)-threonylcarbamoyltransferase complex ATPase subunit type 1 TsaE [Candidatus Parcubacteria bacterium]|uniref:tRNA threonylcarbamoyladenosine biosynthesis protein TsaE n=1 Tax=Candidatus Kaiserbacteria bacterium CG10_big_fil_rev_8_21_14_0_10_47_16 TaxID=1974608 RepID=A0A2H0UDX7_9BACT|nr:tRNA (adenosine(37)-N6)-threonylcarbamoyltransferase complex ATPase subunit type 1 TsaE [Candidatus Parcubacteria bacterium]PIR84628.1 MAG: tRNA (adenosine(37)-N6)-threonylcarbamoyltransferase complex ATPase subunit type 1 TsaE [Candidatus Kaiserbacteria bacterium CG10_big_fil_rev_8_21_14_0_10_47_16]